MFINQMTSSGLVCYDTVLQQMAYCKMVILLTFSLYIQSGLLFYLQQLMANNHAMIELSVSKVQQLHPNYIVRKVFFLESFLGGAGGGGNVVYGQRSIHSSLTDKILFY